MARREALLAWYRPRRGAYPWRSSPPDPYAVLVSEVMLQQTQVSRVIPIYEAFLGRFPTVGSLAAASRGDVVRAWAGLGYHRRALALREAARQIAQRRGGEVPRAIEELRELPGIGPYTAAAVASIAFEEPVAAIDTNVRRVIARLLMGVEPDELSPAALRAGAAELLDHRDPGGWNQAVMDLGRAVCRPRPRCADCPLLQTGCLFAVTGREGRPSTRAQAPFDGSMRQARGQILSVLRRTGGARIGELIEDVGLEPRRVFEAARGLQADGLVSLAAWNDGVSVDTYVSID